jgi:hypothetical protein
MPTGRYDKKKILPTPAALHHMVEDFLTNWDSPLSHLMPLRRFLDAITHSDLRQRFGHYCFQAAMTHQTVSPFCQDGYMAEQGLPATQTMLDSYVIMQQTGSTPVYV